MLGSEFHGPAISFKNKSWAEDSKAGICGAQKFHELSYSEYDRGYITNNKRLMELAELAKKGCRDGFLPVLRRQSK